MNLGGCLTMFDAILRLFSSLCRSSSSELLLLVLLVELLLLLKALEDAVASKLT